MNEHIIATQAAMAVFFGTMGAVLGWKGIMLLLLAIVMLLDYISGTLAAKRTGTWSSTVAREGLFHKGGIILVTMCALLADSMFCIAIPVIPIAGGLDNPGLFLPLVLAWYIVTEIGSVLENAVKMGANVPKFFRDAIKHTQTTVDHLGEGNLHGGDSSKDAH